MSRKKFKKRLLLNKTTVADLNGKEMSELYGGAPPVMLVLSQLAAAPMIGHHHLAADILHDALLKVFDLLIPW